MKAVFIGALLAVVAGSAVARDVYVAPRTNSNGSTTQGHYRSAPDGNVHNNFSTQGNVNPYTGQPGTVSPYQQPQPQRTQPLNMNPMGGNPNRF